MAVEGVPDWRDAGPGLLKRIGAYLASEVGEGNTVSVGALHEAFPDPNATRRLRDLRTYGWELDRVGDGQSISYRLVKIGEPVWEPAHSPLRRRAALSSRRRMQVLERDDFLCQACGVGAGESHLDPPHDRARLTVHYRIPISEGGIDAVDNLVTVCDRCRPVGQEKARASAGEIATQARTLPMKQQAALLGWMTLGERPRTTMDRIWAAYRHMNDSDRQALRTAIAASFAVEEEDLDFD
ncbi:HNH endonuclease [Streptomyces sp. NPDC059695]|uniref:HNH endonuclease n=1 Tax=Streptomyces sp. NPDC059695 TaxID=3346910 RepID=UPI00367B7EB9